MASSTSMLARQNDLFLLPAIAKLARWRFKQIRQLTVGEGGGAHPSDLSTDLGRGAAVAWSGASVPFASRLSPCIRGPVCSDPRQLLLHRGAALRCRPGWRSRRAQRVGCPLAGRCGVYPV